MVKHLFRAGAVGVLLMVMVAVIFTDALVFSAFLGAVISYGLFTNWTYATSQRLSPEFSTGEKRQIRRILNASAAKRGGAHSDDWAHPAKDLRRVGSVIEDVVDLADEAGAVSGAVIFSGGIVGGLLLLVHCAGHRYARLWFDQRRERFNACSFSLDLKITTLIMQTWGALVWYSAIFFAMYFFFP